MAKITQEDIKKIAEMTKVSIEDHEIEGILKQFNDILLYVERVEQVAKEVHMPIIKNINSDRSDIVYSTSSVDILAQGPQSEDNYFVVPKFIDN